MVAAYRALADALIEAIRASEYGPGDKLPTMRELIAGRGVGLTVAQDAYAALAREGWVERNRKTGTFVRDPLPGGLSGPSLEERVSALEEWRRSVEGSGD